MKYNKNLLEQAARKSTSISEVCRKIGIKQLSGGLHAYIKKKLIEYKINTEHFLGQKANCGDNHKGGPAKILWQEILVCKKSNKRTRSTLLRRALIEFGREYKCEKEGCIIKNIWLNNKITLQVNHKNDIFYDNRPENLEFLCPNCHSQTPNWCRRKTQILV